MKFNYLFVEQHDGHEKTFHPFASNTSLTQARVTNLLNALPGARRISSSMGQLLELLDREGVDFTQVTCPCCEQIVHPMNYVDYKFWERVAGVKWILLNGVLGNY